MGRIAPSVQSDDGQQNSKVTVLHTFLWRLASWICGDVDLNHCASQNSPALWQKRRWMSRTAAMALTWILTGCCGMMWGSVYLIFSLPQASMPPFLYTVICLLGFFSLRMINKFHLANLDSTVFVFGHIQLILMLILPISMHLVLGGLARSNASCVMSWCIIAPAGAIFYCQGPTGNSRRSLETATKPSPALACFLPSVFMDMHVSIAVTAYVAASATIIACEPFLPAVQLPPLLLRQASPQ
mmetsp:Transcript_60788/g.127398  ORF Transcript_60788/g.127398 Transcript_60788/m.127398 type:complete len:242 (-) Transcript_60788:278-1003(-)